MYGLMETFEYAVGDVTQAGTGRPAPQGNHVCFESCEEYKVHDLGDMALVSTGVFAVIGL